MALQAVISVLELVEKEERDAFNKIFHHRIAEHCLSIFNANGTMRKCQKSKLIDNLKFVEINPSQYTAIVDMGMIWRTAIPNNDERQKIDGTEYTWYAN